MTEVAVMDDLINPFDSDQNVNFILTLPKIDSETGVSSYNLPKEPHVAAF